MKNNSDARPNPHTQQFTASDYGGIVLSAGGIKGYYELGVLQYYHIRGYLDKVTVFAGASIGSVICGLYIAGYDPVDILNKSLDVEIVSSQDADFKNITRDYGIYNPQRLKTWLDERFIDKYTYVPTLYEFYLKTKKHLILCVYNVSKTRNEYFSWQTEPDMPVTDAIVASCTVPLGFKAFQYKGNLYVDGARGEICPLEYTVKYKEPYTDRKIMCVTFQERMCENFTDFCNSLLVNRNVKVEDALRYAAVADIIFLPNEYVPFDVTREMKLQLFRDGLKYITTLAETQAEDSSNTMPMAENLTGGSTLRVRGARGARGVRGEGKNK